MASVITHRKRRDSLRRWAVVCVLLIGLALLSGCGPAVMTGWSPDGSAVAYATEGSLYLYDVATKQLREVATPGPYVASPAWSPDGKAIACYAGPRESAEALSLCTVDPASGRVSVLAEKVVKLPTEAEMAEVPPDKLEERFGNDPRVAALFAIDLGQTISWSPDGQQIACLAASADEFSVVVVDIASGSAKRIIESDTCIWLIAWSPDGTRLTYLAADRDPTPVSPEPALFTYDFATDTRTKITDLPGDGFALGTRLQWSPDSTQIGVIVSDPGNDSAMGCLVEAKPGAEVRKAVRGITKAASWSPDLKGIVFVEDRENAPVVLYRGVQPPVRKALGEITEASPMTYPPYSIPQFSPDGRFVSFLVLKEEGIPKVEVLAVR